ncbi:ABC transporter permease [soil metagenome]
MTSETLAIPPSARSLSPVLAVGGWPAAIGWIVILIVVAAGVLAPLIAPGDPNAQNLLMRNRAPGQGALLGTDHLGRDVFTRLLYGARISLAVGVAGTAVALGLGAGLMGLAMAAGRPVAAGFSAVVDLVRALPGVLLALVLVAAIGAGAGPVIFATGISFLPMFAVVTVATLARERRAGYVRAALVLGAGRLRLFFVHMLPNILGALVTLSAIVLPRVITLESVLSFFGLGVSPETPSWGRMIADATRFVERAPHAVAFPTLLLVITTLAIAVAGDGLRRRSDPLRRSLAR